MPQPARSVAAAVLAYSRHEILPRLIDALRGQTVPPSEIIVVYQGDRDDTWSWLSRQPDLTVLRQENKGSAGGFCTAILESMRRGHAWTWIFDDDAIPERTALEELVSRPYFAGPDTVFLASRVVDPSGRTYMSPKPANANRWYGTVLQDRCVEVVGACWLGLLVSSEAVRKVGLPIAEFYLWDEDVEFTERLARGGRAYCAIDSVIAHHQDPVFDPFGKDFVKFAYWARNRVARAKVEPGSWPARTIRVCRRAGHFLGLVLKRDAPLRTIPWVLRGLFLFWPRIRPVPVELRRSGTITLGRA